jgi:hypothetical protein
LNSRLRAWEDARLFRACNGLGDALVDVKVAIKEKEEKKGATWLLEIDPFYTAVTKWTNRMTVCVASH